jgi:tRNA (guanine-N7-)-methyltransferase
MPRKKNKRTQAIQTFANVAILEHGADNSTVTESIQTKTNPYSSIILELGCGKGEYTLYLAKQFPKALCIGVDIKGDRIWRGAKEAEEQNLSNAMFIRTQIHEITNIFKSASTDAIWLTFSDPQPKDKQAKKRLTHERFMEQYVQLLKPKGEIHVKTDNQALYTYSKYNFEQDERFKLLWFSTNVYSESDSAFKFAQGCITTFEKKKCPNGEPVFYLQVLKL